MPKIWNVHVKPNSSVLRVEVFPPDLIEVKLKAPPKKGKANKELIEVLADYFNVKKTDVQIIRGLKSRDKIISIG
jgi:hypothetical protein